jgi:peptidyl-prolyl cis-trans isomerase D
MFDLFRSREKSVRYLLGALLTLVALSMVITLVPGYGGGWGRGSGSDPTILAEIGKDKVTAEDVRKYITRELRDKVPPGSEAVYIPQIVEEMAAAKAVGYVAGELGLEVNDKLVAEMVRDTIPQLFEGGKFVGKQVYAEFLSRQGMTIPEFEDSLRISALGTTAQNLALEGMVVTPAEVETAYKQRYEKIKIAYFTLSREAVRKKVTISPAELEAGWAKHGPNYKLPEQRSYLVFPIGEKEVAAGLKIPETELKRQYAANQERFRTPERVHAHHILVMTKDKPAAEVAKLEKKAEDLLKQLKAGGDFAALAKKNSDDPGSAAKGGDLDWVVRGQTVPEFEKAAFTLKPGELSGLVKTQYGYHILKIAAHEQARVRPFEEAKGELAVELAHNQVRERMQTLADQIRAALIKSTAEAEKLAHENGITPVKALNVTNGNPVEGIGSNDQFKAEAANLPVNGVTSVIQVGQDSLAVAKVINITAPRPAALKDVEAQLRDALLTEKTNEQIKQTQATLNSKLAGANGDLAGLAKSIGAEVKTPPEVTRADTVASLGPASSIMPAFSANAGQLLGPFSFGQETCYLKVLEKTPADLTQLAAQRSGLQQALKAERARERALLFKEGVVRTLMANKKLKIFEKNIKLLQTSYMRQQ